MMRLPFKLSALPVFLAAAFLAAFNMPAAKADITGQIVTTTAQTADLARAVAGSEFEVTALMGEGVDPHTYRQSRRDIVLLRQADLIVANGLYLEAQLEPLLEELSGGQEVVLIGELLDKGALLNHPDYEGKFDPHVWMDVQLWARAGAALAQKMSALWPEHASEFTVNWAAYEQQLMRLDGYVRDVILSIPEESRVLITAHDAFQYLSRAYGIEVEGIQGLSTESEAGLKRIEDLVEMIVRRKLGAVFVESSVAERNVQALVEGAAAKGHDLRIGGSLFSDAMGAAGTYEGTYAGMIDHNATLIARSLGGIAPENGLNGQLRATE